MNTSDATATATPADRPAVPLLGSGIYSIAEAARYARLSKGTVRRWFRGPGALFRMDHDGIDGFCLSFRNLVELVVAGQLRAVGVPLDKIRRARDDLARDRGDAHPFALEAFAAPGWPGGSPPPILAELDYDDAPPQRATLWHISPGIVLNPGIRFGSPIVEGTGMRAECLADAYRANGEDVDLVARWWAVRPGHVRAAVAFEEAYPWPRR
jgi:uncharacterized protein (DUF433 family)